MIFIPTITEYQKAGFAIKEIFYIKKSFKGLSASEILGEAEERANEDDRYLELIKLMTISIQA